MGYAAGPAWLVDQMRKLQQFTFVCAPTPLQWGVVPAFDHDNREQIAAYQRRRDRVVEVLSPHANVTVPGGAFYAFFELPAELGIDGSAFVERAVERRVLLVAGGVFSARDTHVRLSYAVEEDVLEEGLRAIVELLQGR